MAKVRPGRVVVDHDEDLVVFTVGMRINKFWKFGKWVPVFTAMPRMLRELEADPDLGLLDSRIMVGGRVIMVVQYWRSEDHLERYAHSRVHGHRGFWKWFNRNVKSNGEVGLWHELYRVPAGAHDTSYVNMPPYGLAKATGDRAAERTDPDDHGHETGTGTVH
ncbi:DUF4188 domain-containing protein [Glycomyces sp. TRM65418]|uniref:DUF4188 domain-containing protein n=1 Tax=Glycomyces sp. TRM65418 TaxID=2867006 RepID=UPI001CE66A43|nr:DUF4188 domain-containing protein [Glycomyces sp. TRM65418]MCC3761882.1 DUF4188 domain-containing protein [Glycomyces sp. TRM65418]QZD55963.1 DUF4188 domain-containing protein [Glycomyces sp. TRM65418]